MKKLHLISLVILSVSTMLFTSSCEETDMDYFVAVDHSTRSVPGKTNETESATFDQNGLFGKSNKQWVQDWWRSMMSFDCNHSPLTLPNFSTTINQSDPIVFLAGTPNGIATRYIEIPKGKTLLIPVINVLKEYPSPSTDQNPRPGQTVEQFLKIEAAKYMNLATNMKVVLDGNLIKINNTNRIATDLFYFKANKDLSGCLGQVTTGQLQVGVSDGYWIMIGNLAPGRHTLHTHAEILHSGVVPDVYYDIVVR